MWVATFAYMERDCTKFNPCTFGCVAYISQGKQKDCNGTNWHSQWLSYYCLNVLCSKVYHDSNIFEKWLSFCKELKQNHKKLCTLNTISRNKYNCYFMCINYANAHATPPETKRLQDDTDGLWIKYTLGGGLRQWRSNLKHERIHWTELLVSTGSDLHLVVIQGCLNSLPDLIFTLRIKP